MIPALVPGVMAGLLLLRLHDEFHHSMLGQEHRAHWSARGAAAGSIVHQLSLASEDKRMRTEGTPDAEWALFTCVGEYPFTARAADMARGQDGMPWHILVDSHPSSVRGRSLSETLWLAKAAVHASGGSLGRAAQMVECHLRRSFKFRLDHEAEHHDAAGVGVHPPHALRLARHLGGSLSMLRVDGRPPPPGGQARARVSGDLLSTDVAALPQPLRVPPAFGHTGAGIRGVQDTRVYTALLHLVAGAVNGAGSDAGLQRFMWALLQARPGRVPRAPKTADTAQAAGRTL